MAELDRDALKQEMTCSLGIFQEGGQRLSQALDTLSGGAGKVGRTLNEAAARLAENDRVVKIMRGAGSRLDRIAAMSGPAPMSAAVEAQIRNFAAGQYTMASEREIHRTLGALDIAGAPPPGPPAEASVDDFLF